MISLEKKGNKAALKAMLEKAAAVLEDSDAYVACSFENSKFVKHLGLGFSEISLTGEM